MNCRDLSETGLKSGLASTKEERAFKAPSKRCPSDPYLIAARVLLIDVIGRNHVSNLAREAGNLRGTRTVTLSLLRRLILRLAE